MVEPTTRQRVEALLQANIDAATLRYELTMLALAEPTAFAEAADVWFPALVARDLIFFQSLLQDHLTIAHKSLIDPLLPQIEAAGATALYQRLYRLVGDSNRWNSDLLVLAKSADPDKIVREAIDRREFYDWSLDSQTALALYERNPSVFTDFILRHIRSGENDYSALLDAIRRNNNDDLYWKVFRYTATSEMWRTALLVLLARNIPDDRIEAQLVKLQPTHQIDISIDVVRALIKKYGGRVTNFLRRNSSWFLGTEIDRLLRADLDNETLLREFTVLAQGQWYNFAQMADKWAPILYERDADYFGPFLKSHLGHRSKAEIVGPLLARIEANGHDALFRVLYRYQATEAHWNRDLLALAQSDLSDDQVEQAIDRRGTTSYALHAETALALFKRNPARFGEFVRNRLFDAGSYSADLLNVARQVGDEETYWALFCAWANNATWQAEMQHLLDQDIPADQIVAELEKRHPRNIQHIEPAILRRFVEKYGQSVAPYLEKHLNLVSRQRLERLLALRIDRAALLRELEKLARRQPTEFRALAGVWAFALYERDPGFFESFLVRNLDRAEAHVIEALLPRIEAAGQDSLFKSLYRKIADEDEWDHTIRLLAASKDSDENVLRAIERYDAQSWFDFSEETALALYRRSADHFRDYLKTNLRRRWSSHGFRKLREMARANGDEDFFGHLFREFADNTETHTELKRLLGQDIPAEDVGAEIEKRLPSQHWQFAGHILLDFLKKYGMAVWPQVKPYLSTLAHQRSKEILPAIKRLNDETLYWQVFFQSGDVPAWNQILSELVKRRPLSDNELALELQYLTPDGDGNSRWQRWRLTPDIALALYRCQPTLTRPFLERFLDDPGMELFQAASERGDEEFLDYLTFKFMQWLSTLVVQAYPKKSTWGWRAPDPKARQQIEQLGQVLTDRFDRLYAQSPETYVRHVANVLARIRAFEIWAFTDQLAHNLVIAYVLQRHREAWHRSANGIRELMESPNIYVQLIGLEILNEGSPDAAARIVENQMMFRALLLGRARRNTKRKVLTCLEKAIHQGPEFAAALLPLLEETMDCRGEQAISERLMVSYIRNRRQVTPEVVR